MNAKFDPAVVEAEENLLIDFQFLLQEIMTQKGITLTELAEKAGVSKGRISQIMSPDANPTAKTFARLFHALGEKVFLSRKRAKREVYGLVLGDRGQRSPADWQWSNGPLGERRVDDRFVAVVKDAVSNDNHAPKVVYMDAENMTLEAA